MLYEVITQVNQAVVDNAYALAGVKETSNIALQFNDVTTKREVWQVFITKIVDNVNKIDMKVMKDSVITSYSIHYTKLYESFGMMMGTLMACESIGDLEQRYLRMLGTVTGYRLEGDRLDLRITSYNVCYTKLLRPEI